MIGIYALETCIANYLQKLLTKGGLVLFAVLIFSEFVIKVNPSWFSVWSALMLVSLTTLFFLGCSGAYIAFKYNYQVTKATISSFANLHSKKKKVKKGKQLFRLVLFILIIYTPTLLQL